MAQCPIENWAVDPKKNTHDGVLVLIMQFSPDKQRGQHRHKRESQRRGSGHRKGLGKGQRMKQLPCLSTQRKDRNEGQHDDDHRKEDRSYHQIGRPENDLGDILRIGKPRHFSFLNGMGLTNDGFRDHNSRVNQHADGNGNAAERHDIGGHSRQLHHDEGDQNRERQWHGDNHHTSDVSQENEVGQCDQDHLFNQRNPKCAYRPVDEFASIIERPDRDTRRQSLAYFRDLFFKPPDDIPRALPISHHNNPADNLLTP